jgi:hypothetical protein
LQSYIFVESTKAEPVATTATSTHDYMIFQTAELPPKLNIQLQNPVKRISCTQEALSLSLTLSLCETESESIATTATTIWVLDFPDCFCHPN